MDRGEIWWASLPVPTGSEPGFDRPVVIIQSDRFNRSSIDTVIVVAVTSNLRLQSLPGNIPIPARQAGLTKNSVINISQLVTADRRRLIRCVGRLSPSQMRDLEDGLRLILDL